MGFPCAQSAVAAAPPGAQVFGALPAQTEPTLSPDGHLLAWIEHRESQDRAVLWNLDARKVQRAFVAPQESDLRTLRWHDNQTLLIGESTSGFASNRLRLIAFDVDGGAGHEVLSPFNYVVAWRTSKPHTMIVATGANLADKELLEADTRTGATSRIALGDPHTVNWVVDRDGKPVAREPS
jgi:hypothetical protein